jgi:protein-S-isoprenylcysteine O-methyltransferase Ste14
LYTFLVPLIAGFLFDLASAFTATYSRRWGDKAGTLVTFLFRDFLGIPVWVIGFGLAVLAPSKLLYSPNMITNIAGWLLVVAGAGIIMTALFSIRRRAAVPSTQDTLAETGLYAIVRHPIHSGTLLEFAGLCLVIPSLTVFLACLLGVGWVLLQTGLEEHDLLQRMPAYRDYMQRVPRFIPSLYKKNPGPKNPIGSDQNK